MKFGGIPEIGGLPKRHLKAFQCQRGDSRQQHCATRSPSTRVVLSDDWPHFYVFKGTNRKPATFDELEVDECEYGCLKMMENCGSHVIKSVLLSLLTSTIHDSADLGWSVAQAALGGGGGGGGGVLREIERGNLSW